MRRARRVIALVTVAVVLAGCVEGPTVERSGLGAPVDVVPDPDPTAWGTVSGDPARERASTGGVVVVQTNRSVTAPVTGRVTAVDRGRGDVVADGDVLLTIQATSAAVDELESAILALAAALAGGSSDAELEELLDARNAAAARVDAEAPFGPDGPVDVLAPTDGVLSGVEPTLGERVEAGQVVATMGETAEVEVQAGIPTGLLDAVDAGSGDAVVIRRDGTGGVIRARIADAEDRIVGTEDDGATTVVRFVFDEPPPLTDGTRVDLEIEIDAGERSAAVPIAALRDVGDEVFVLAEVEDDIVRVDVEVRLVGDELAEVEGDLTVGQAVLLR
ncbi:MAG: efflux RND transporter periplasmic adaptor subunit [Actinomycetota bacterium]